jgi:regulatory protein
MDEITAIKLQKRNHKRVNIYLNGEFAFGLARILAAWLQVGQIISEEKIAELRSEDEIETAYQRALKLFDYRDRSEHEVRQKLTHLNIDKCTIDAVINRLTKGEIINDRRFAAQWIANRTEFRPRSQRALRYELIQKGISDAIISNTLELVDDEKACYEAAQKQSRKYNGLEWSEFRKRMVAFLARRGFHYQIANQTTERIFEELKLTNDVVITE